MSLWGIPEIEDQAFEEALILMLLIRNHIRAEVPQAILEHSNGRKELVTKGIRSGNGLFRSRNNRQCYDQVGKLEVQEQWVAVDFFHTSNRIIDEQGYSHVIDVNRWQVPQLHFVRKRIMKLLLSRLSNSTNNAKLFTQAS